MIDKRIDSTEMGNESKLSVCVDLTFDYHLMIGIFHFNLLCLERHLLTDDVHALILDIVLSARHLLFMRTK